MTQYLTPRQRQLFIDRLAEENDAPQLSGDQRRAALQQGANMARADMQGLPDEEGFFPEKHALPEENASDENGAMAERLAALGFENAGQLADAYERLERAYDAVRSHRYRSEERLLDDPEAVKRLSADPRVREAVLSAHLAGIYKSAAALPAFIDDGGNIPVAEPVKGGMDRAKAKLTAMLAGGR